MREFPSLLAPLEFGRLRLKNRVVFPGHQTLFSEGGVVGDRMLEYYRARARGGTAAVIIEGAAVHPTTIKFPNYLLAYDPAIVPTLDRLADALHEFDCRAILQVAHSGSRMNTQDTRLALWAPSAQRSANSPEIPHAMDQRDIDALLDGYEVCARNVAASRVDGIEVHAAHEYLLSAFLSPLSNTRTDDYGGSLENRCRLVVEAVRRVRDHLRDDQALGIRINGSDMLEGGLTPADAADIAGHLCRHTDLDYIHVSAGRSSHNEVIVPPMDVPLAAYEDLARAVKEASDVPVICVGRLKTPEAAEEVLARGAADVVAVARAQIADPDWVNKAATDRATIRPCLGCNQGCYGNLVLVRPISCAVNPEVGFEAEYAERADRRSTSRHLVVLGGGPAGLEAALTGAQRGHRVTLVESRDKLGGQLPLGAAVAARRELRDIVDHQIARIHDLGVDVRLGTQLSDDEVLALEPDHVVVATGSAPAPPSLELDGSVPVLNAHQLLTDGPPAGATEAVVVDGTGHFQAYVAAEVLADQGVKTRLVTAPFAPGWALDPTTAATMTKRLAAKGVRFVLHHRALRVAEGGLRAADVLTGEETSLPAGVVVLAEGQRADGRYAGLGERVPTTRVGDCLAPRTVLEAIREGRHAVLDLDATVHVDQPTVTGSVR